MKNEIPDFVCDQVGDCIKNLIENDVIEPDNINGKIDVVYKSTLIHLIEYFHDNESKYRSSESKIIQKLMDKIDELQASTIIQLETHIFSELSKIPPIYGRLFGTDRGKVYASFQYLRQWPCFSRANLLLQIERKLSQLSIRLTNELTTNSQKADKISKKVDRSAEAVRLAENLTILRARTQMTMLYSGR